MLQFEKTTSDEILPLTKFYRDRRAGEILYKCPHCGNIRGMDIEYEHDDFVGSQFQDNLCDGHSEVSEQHSFVKDVDDL